MPNLRIYIEDLNGNQVVGTEALDTIDYATNLQYSNAAPKGHLECRFRLRRRDIYAGFEVKESYGVVVQDGLRVVWQGRIEGLNLSTSGGDEYLDCRAVGWWVILTERLIRKRWVDTTAGKHFYVPDALIDDPVQLSFVTTKRDNWLTVLCGTRDITRVDTEEWEEHYTPWAVVKTIAYDYSFRTGESFRFRIKDIDGSTTDYTSAKVSSAAGSSSTFSHTMTVDTEVIGLVLNTSENDTFDQNDYVSYKDITIEAKYHASHSALDSELYNITELLQDVLWLVEDYGAALSSDFDDIATIATVLNGFTVEEFTPANIAIDRIIDFSDSSNNTYFPYVWDREGTSDNLPKFELSAWGVDDYEYIIDIDDPAVSAATNEKDGRQLYNWVAVQYVDTGGNKAERTPDDNASLKDTTSIANEYQRMEVLKIGKATATDADNIGERFLTWHKNRKWRGSITLSGDVETKAGGTVPVEWLRSGQRYYVPQLDQIFFIRTCNIDAENRRATITPDLPPDDTNLVIDKLRYQAAAANRRPVYSGAG